MADTLLCIFCRRHVPELVIDPDAVPSVAMCWACYAIRLTGAAVSSETQGEPDGN